LPKNVSLSACELKSSVRLFSGNPFFRCYKRTNLLPNLWHYFCQRNKRPCSLSEKLRYCYEGGGDRKGWDNNKFPALVPAQIPLQLLPLQLLEVTRIQRKIIRRILTLGGDKLLAFPPLVSSLFFPLWVRINQ
jgi:hypothetical protein